ncbi:unnamed protein product, partial [Brassica rapa subsp. trilocularis]
LCKTENYRIWLNLMAFILDWYWSSIRNSTIFGYVFCYSVSFARTRSNGNSAKENNISSCGWPLNHEELIIS